jgi:ubiquinone/menaquinone biosynthesis C-methylase UbiE
MPAWQIAREHMSASRFEFMVAFARRRLESANLQEAWEKHAASFIRWALEPMHDIYWHFHRDAFLAILPPPGDLTLDIGCGEGRLSRDLTSLGHNVLGIDSSPTMVQRAQKADPSIQSRNADAVSIPLPNSAADLAVAFMSLHDMDDMPAAVKEIGRVLRPSGTFCFAVVHPLMSAGKFLGEGGGSRFAIDDSYLESFYYEDTLHREGLSVTFTSRHHPLSAYFAALAANGFVVDQLREPVPADESDDRWRRIPRFLHVRAVRTAAVLAKTS